MPAPPKLGPPPLPKPLFIRINPATTTPLPTPLTNLKYRPGTADSFESFEGYGEPASLESEALHEQPSEITDISCQKAISSQSLSSFGISMGHCLTSSSGFQYYRETSRVSPITIGLFVRRLEKLCREFDVHWAEVTLRPSKNSLRNPFSKKSHASRSSNVSLTALKSKQLYTIPVIGTLLGVCRFWLHAVLWRRGGLGG
ncbi:hypothetical protein BC829DRAFT_50369 [Chytridium lagenaria]|nr:hypothetical protein BC829DRAFT_50369 [Chytridium lagenaria]